MIKKMPSQTTDIKNILLNVTDAENVVFYRFLGWMLSPVEFLPSEAMKASDDNRPVYGISIFWLFLLFSKKENTKTYISS